VRSRTRSNNTEEVETDSQSAPARGRTGRASWFDVAEDRQRRILWLVCAAAGVIGLVGWAIGGVGSSVTALWAFVVLAVGLALVLPFTYALVSPLFMGIVGWLVDMLPLVILAGWTAVVLRWAWGLWRERRLPRGGRWRLLPVTLLVWTFTGGLAIAVSGFEDLMHFVLLLGIQFVTTGILLAVVDRINDLEEKTQVVSGLALFVTVLSAAVLLQWLGVPVENLQNPTASRMVESAYGLDSFPNSIGMIKYARSVEAGAERLRQRLDPVAERADLPDYAVFRPRLQAYENSLVVRFDGSVREHQTALGQLDIDLIFDNLGLAPANTVPRLRSFPRNALTYAGVCVALFPLMLWLAWSFEGRRRLLGRLAAASCLFGAGFSLARGSWIAILIGVAYLLIDGLLSRSRKIELIAWYLAAALVLFGTFMVNYGVDPVTGRAGGGSSVSTRSSLYVDTVDALLGYQVVTGYGTEQPRLDTGTVRGGEEGGEYVPRAGTHSTFLNYLFRTGLPGMLMIGAIYAFAALAARARARKVTGRARTFYTLATAAVVSAAAHGVILSLFVEPTYTLTVSLVLALATTGLGTMWSELNPWKARRTSTEHE
jgi:hypothetical protein